MKKYQCHKIVEAEKIAAIIRERRPDGDLRFRFESGSEMTMDAKIVARGDPSPGDYLVRYEDGYLSWSPKAVFEAGYTLIDEELGKGIVMGKGGASMKGKS